MLYFPNQIKSNLTKPPWPIENENSFECRRCSLGRSKFIHNLNMLAWCIMFSWMKISLKVLFCLIFPKRCKKRMNFFLGCFTYCKCWEKFHVCICIFNSFFSTYSQFSISIQFFVWIVLVVVLLCFGLLLWMMTTFRQTFLSLSLSPSIWLNK